MHIVHSLLDCDVHVLVYQASMVLPIFLLSTSYHASVLLSTTAEVTGYLFLLIPCCGTFVCWSGVYSSLSLSPHLMLMYTYHLASTLPASLFSTLLCHLLHAYVCMRMCASVYSSCCRTFTVSFLTTCTLSIS